MDIQDSFMLHGDGYTNLLWPLDGSSFDTHTPLQNELIARIKKDGTEAAMLWLDTVKKRSRIIIPGGFDVQVGRRRSGKVCV